jgi:hypothetical protein
MYILGLSPSWGISRICPAWSPSEHQLAPALSPILGPCLKPRRPEEVVYSLNDSCSHFTQRLFPPKLPQQHTWTVSYNTFNIIHTYQTSHSHKLLSLLFTWRFHSFISSGPRGRPAALSLLCPLQFFLTRRRPRHQQSRNKRSHIFHNKS